MAAGNEFVTIVAERPDGEAGAALIGELEDFLMPLYPAQSRHGFSVQKLIAEKVAFFVLRYKGTPAGCGGVKLFGTEYGEIKRIFIRQQFRGLGLSTSMMEHLEEYARERGISILRLETGIYQPKAIGLYEKLGYRRVGPFGEYKEDPLSLYFEKRVV